MPRFCDAQTTDVSLLDLLIVRIILFQSQVMSFELALKKAGLPLVRSFLHSIEGIEPALPTVVKKRNVINFKVKQYKDGKIANQKIIETIEESFPCKGDKK